MSYKDLRDYIHKLEDKKLLKRVGVEVSTDLEISAIMEKLVQEGGVAAIFENVVNEKGKKIDMPIIANLYGTRERVKLGLNATEEELKEIGEFIALLQRPKPPEGIVDAIKKMPVYGKALTIGPKTVFTGKCQEVVLTGEDATLDKLPIIKCWPKDVGSLITWPLVITAPPGDMEKGPQNVGVYRMQKLDGKRAIMRWLPQRGGARHQRLWKEKGEAMPVAIAIGCEPATTIAAVTPVPEEIGEFHFAGVLRKKAIELVKCKTIPLRVPASSEIVLEGEIRHGDLEKEGPFGDHTGYYNAEEKFPVFHLKAITHRKKPYYLTTITGRPPKEDAIIGTVLNTLYLPSLKLQMPEVVDFSLPMEAVSYRIAVVSIKKSYPGHAKRVMMGLWGLLKQFLYVKYIIVVDEDIDVHNWSDVIWAMSTRVDPGRDTFVIEDTPMDYLDFSSPKDGLGSKMGIDATNKIGSEVTRPWGEKMTMSEDILERIEKKWKEFKF
ncbi:MAG: UbiD family decarboxylase [Deltaproteobacteria bacterium]|nr:UbiD family decarboxylase [Deltaproteobacteria bacterium]